MKRTLKTPGTTLRKGLSILLALVLCLGALTAVAEGGKEELVMWGGWSGDSIAQFTEMLDAYNAAQDKVHITYQYVDGLEQKLLTSIAGGETCDVVLWDRFNTSTYAPKGALLPLDEMVAADGVDLATFFAPTVDELVYDGKLYGLPTMVDTRVLFCNIDLLNEAGIDYQQITTWEKLEEAAIAATKRDAEGKLEQSGYVMNDLGLFSAYLWQAGGELINNETDPATTAFNSEAGLAALNFINRLQNEDGVYEVGFNEAYNGQAFIAGKAAMMVSGPWDLNNVLNAGINLGIIPCPAGAGGYASGLGGFGLAIPALSAHPREAMDFIEWWACDAENSVLFTKINGYLPANVHAAEDPFIKDNPYLTALFDAFQYGRIRPKTLGYASMEGLAMTPQWQLFMNGEITAEQALATAEQQGNALLAEAAMDY